MKFLCRRFASTLFLVVFLFQVVPIAVATPRDSRDRDIPSIVKIIKRFLGIKALEELPAPPRP